MKLYQTVDGTLIGFYQERGGVVEIEMFTDVYETVMVEKSEMVFTFGIPDLVTEFLWIEGHWEQRNFNIPEHIEYQPTVIEAHWQYKTWTEAAHWGTREYWLEPYIEVRYREVPAHYETERQYVQGHYEIQMFWFDEYTVTRYREVPGHYEIQPVWFEAYYVTKYYWREAHPARGLEAAWIPYQELVPAGYSDTRVWVETYTEEYQEIMPAGEKETRVWVEGEFADVEVWIATYIESYEVTIPGVWQERRIWFTDVTRTTKTWVPLHEEILPVTIPEYDEVRTVWADGRTVAVVIDIGTKDSWEKRTWFEPEQVWVGYDAVYKFVDETQVRLFEVGEINTNVFDVPEYTDSLTIINKMNGEVFTTSAKYVGLAERTAENEYRVP
ncbi:MAG TPA: hypothetical protein ENH62_14495 [Marinobacter sp.]|nr:hypothetical protein [Marinobacter sp.]